MNISARQSRWSSWLDICSIGKGFGFESYLSNELVFVLLTELGESIEYTLLTHIGVRVIPNKILCP